MIPAMSLLHDIPLAVRLMARSPGFSAAALLTIALAVGANTAIFSLVYGVLWRPLPYPDAGRLVRLSERHPGAVSPFGDEALISSLTFDSWERTGSTIEQFGAYSPRSLTVTGVGEPERVRGAGFSPFLFEMLGVVPVHGRTFAPSDAVEGSAPVAVVGYRYWRSRLAGDPAAIGRTIVLNGRATQVVGVAPEVFAFPERQTQIFVPYGIDRPDPADPESVGVMPAVGRLALGATPAQAAAEGTSAARSVERPLAAEMLFGKGGTVEVDVRGLAEEATLRVRPAMLALISGVALLLLVACVNVANLFLSRAVGRGREMAVRAALGASRLRLVRQLLTESLTFAAAGGALGALLGYVLVRVLPLFAPEDFPRLDDVAIDMTALAVNAAAALLVGVLSGLTPALRASRSALSGAMREGDLRTMTAGHSGMRSALLVSEAAFAVVLLVGAALMGRSFVNLANVDPGYEPSNALIGEVYLTGAAAEGARSVQFAQTLMERVRALPGVRASGAGNMAPFGSALYLSGFTIPGTQGPDGKPIVARAAEYAVTDGYAEALGLRLREGRLLTAADATSGTIAIVLNESFVREFLGDGRQVVGRTFADFGSGGQRGEIVGVVADVLPALDRKAQPEFYTALRSDARLRGYLNVILRTDGDPREMVASLYATVRDVEPSAALARVEPLAGRVSNSISEPRFAAAVFISFAVLGLLLAATGLYGVLSYSVSARRREMGVRAALGAGRRDLIALVMRQGLGATIVGLAVGLAASALLTRLMATMLFGVGALDAISFAAAAALLFLVACIACLVPAVRAASTDPAVALRGDA